MRWSDGVLSNAGAENTDSSNKRRNNYSAKQGFMRIFPLPEIERLNVQGRRPAVPSGVKIYAVGDIHGRFDLLDELLAIIDADVATRPHVAPIFVFLGDYIDRGTSSRETVSRLIAHGETNQSVFLKGNHEQMMLRCLEDAPFFKCGYDLAAFKP